MKVLYLLHQLWPNLVMGTERFALNLSGEMRRRGHDARVLAPGQGPSARTVEGVPVTYADPSPAAAAEVLRRGSYDLVHAAHPMRAASYLRAATRAAVPYVITLTDYFTLCHRIQLVDAKGRLCAGPRGGAACARACPVPGTGPAYARERLRATRRLLRAAAAVTAPSRFAADVHLREFPEVPIAVIPHGVAAVAAPSRRRARSRRLTFGYLGMLAPRKGVHVLIKAFRGLRDPDCRLTVYGAGDGDYALELAALARRDRRIRFAGTYASREEAAAALRSIDVLCFPSLWHETYGFVIEEAFAAGVPVLSSRIGAVPERVRHGVDGVLFEPGDERGLRSAMRRLSADPSRLERLRARAHNGIEGEADRYEELYRGILRGGPR